MLTPIEMGLYLIIAFLVLPNFLIGLFSRLRRGKKRRKRANKSAKIAKGIVHT